MLKTNAIGLAGMLFNPRRFRNKMEVNSEMVATKVETVTNDCGWSVRIIEKNGRRVSVGCG